MSFFIFLYFSFLLFLFHPASSRQPLCHDSERSALLQFKESFSIKKFASGDPSAYCKTELWNLEEDGDCCLWDGVECNEDTGYVIELDLGSSCLYGFINSTNTLFNLVHLQWLSLADNNFNNSKIPCEIKNLSKLSHLNLSWSIFSGQIPSEILKLSKLESLVLDRNWLELQQPSLESLVQKLTNLRVLDLGEVNISSALPHVLNLSKDLSSLNFLSLANCELKGTILSSLDNLKNLVHLDLSGNNLWGAILSSLNNLTNLAHLKMKDCNLFGQDPASSLSNFTQLTYLDISQNNFSIPSSLLSWISKNTKLTHLGLSNINIGDEIPLSLMNLNQLSRLDLSYNQLSGHISSQLSNLTQLEFLDLSRNKLQGTIPSSLYNLSNLAYLDISYCNFSSLDPDSSLSKKTKLTHLDLSNNNIGGEIPLSLMNLNQLSRLDLSSNQLSGHIPSQISNLTQLNYLYLYSNQLSGHIPSQISNLTQLKSLDLSSNKLQGSIPSSIFELNNLSSLYLPSNNLSGTIELQMFLRLENLRSLFLSSNHLSLLTNFTVNTGSHKFESLSLGSCNLRGFPDFLRSQDQLYWLDLSSNNISGQIPGWLLNISENSLEYLNLSHNLLTGFDQQPVVLPWTGLSYLDLSFNKLQGPLPISNEKIPNMLVSISLSNNRFEREIPASISILHGLRYLNLSNNNLVGGIPLSLDNLTVLESLDLSNNNLSGEIPPQLIKLTSLAFFDVSYNNFTGPIPHGAQFDTFNNRSYEENPGLCGPPLPRKCRNSELSQKEDDEGSESLFAFGWKVVMIGYASGLIIGVVLGHIFCTRKYEWFAKVFGMPLKRIERKRGRLRN